MRALLDRPYVATAVLALALTACRRPPPAIAPLLNEPTSPARDAPPGARPTPLPQPAVPAAASGNDAATLASTDAAAPAPPPVDPPRATWTTPAVLAELARDCRYLPPQDDEELGALRCDYDLHPQVCTADPCNDRVNDPCRTVCGSQCDGCDRRCRASCASCRSGCADDACRAACAATCGGCLQTCLATRDRCLTAVCGARYAACTRRYNADFDRRCLPACRRCETQCADNDSVGECVQRCARRGGCTAEQAGDCAFTGAVSHVQAALEDSGGSVDGGV